MFEKLLDEAKEAHQRGDFEAAEHRYTALLNLDPRNAALLYILGDLMIRRGKNGLADALLRQAVGQDPKFIEAWALLGVANKNEQRDQQALEAWRTGLRADPDSWKLLVNMSTMYADGIDPEKGVEWSLKALDRIPDDEPQEKERAKWMLAMSLLSLGRWKEGFAFHEARKHLETWHERDYDCAEWDGKPTDLLVIHGEQGVGDEIMFASCVRDAQKVAKAVVIECHGKLVDLMARSFGVPCYRDQKSLLAAGHKPTAKCAFGSLPLHFRSTGEFPGSAYLVADPAKLRAARAWLESLGPGPYVGLGWMGGTKKTRATLRSVELKNLMGLPGTKVSVQYGAFAEDHAKAEGLPHWSIFAGNDSLDDQAALVSALDCVITVPQTLVHVAGAVGTSCHVLVPAAPNWVFKPDPFPWYASVVLHRQRFVGDWKDPISSAGASLAHLGRLQAA